MIAVVGSIECAGSTVSADPWIPLKISWEIALEGQPLYLFVSGDSGGYVELKIDPNSGALYGLVLLESPPQTPRSISQAVKSTNHRVPLVDLDLWDWRVTPDYREPTGRDAEMTCQLGQSAFNDALRIWFSSEPVLELLRCQDATVGIGAHGDLVVVEVPQPAVVHPLRADL